MFTDPWPEAAFGELLGRFARVAVTGPETVVAYLFARHALDEGEILNLAVHPEHLRRGLGTALVHETLRDLGKAGARRVFLEVRASNAVAQTFYHGLGFEPAGRRRAYYSHPHEDALILALEIPGSEGLA